METLILKKPAADLELAALDYKREFFEAGELVIHGAAMLDSMEYGVWLKQTMENWEKATVHDNWVQASTFFAVRESDRRIIGMIDIRHELNDFLAAYGGHIGYSVRPSERRKGYAAQMLNMALEYAKDIGLVRVMLACNADNEASRRTILKCGGMLEREFVYTDGKTVQVYWISL